MQIKDIDSKTNFNLLDKMYIESIISLRKKSNAKRSKEAKSTNEQVHLIPTICYDRSKKLKDTVQR